jgi:nicotinamide riboside kinase
MLPIVWPNQIRNESTSIANKYLLWYKFISHQSFSEVYYNFCDPILDQAAQEHEYDLFFLTDIDVPWEKTIYEMVLTRESLYLQFSSNPYLTITSHL